MSLIFAMKPLIFSMFNNCGHLELFSLSDSLFEHLFHVTDGETVGLELVDDVDCLPCSRFNSLSSSAILMPRKKKMSICVMLYRVDNCAVSAKVLGAQAISAWL